MYVLSWGLEPADLSALEEACEQAGLPLEAPAVDAGGPAGHRRDDLLVAFTGAHGPADPREITRDGAYVVTVQSAPDAAGTLRAVRAGSSFLMASPLREERLRSFLTYLRDVAAPTATQVLDLDDSGLLATPSASVRLTGAEAKALRALADRSARIVARPELLRLTGEDPRDLVEALRARFREIGSGAQILKVPHMGFRLVGEVRTTTAAPR
ncbi:hypothetical protein D9753_17060 [Streptomyces dangxiongensis]|uniref:Uncharacterized protein n=1 Tax=Streptomyces dangxiongensis TaxID=1442032 RepID=A0A3G2JIW2_9ACTN|nr:helix-turn-helix domain-containing protein [Streptomyces dangxiongensis]AYN40332.1 hypothetical protein D9753_17060 [Streptomyces dangxiongensis]